MPYAISGVVVVDKPANITSAKVVSIVKKLFKAKKAGHTGTLDPFATGVMVCCLNRATRLSNFFLHGNKKYQAVLHLGVSTDTQDSTGTIISTCNKIDCSEEAVQAAFKQFQGTITQLPPVYSALKHKGVPLYKLARSGNPVQKPARQVHISYLKIFEIDSPFIRFEVSCSAGTYIRTLCSDIGALLGCGGHLRELRRIENSGFAIEEALTLSELEELARSDKLPSRTISMANALRDMPEHLADNALADKIMNGNALTINDVNPRQINGAEGFIKVVDENNDLIAVLSYAKNSSKYKYYCVFN